MTLPSLIVAVLIGITVLAVNRDDFDDSENYRLRVCAGIQYDYLKRDPGCPKVEQQPHAEK